MATPFQERKMRDTAMNPGDERYFDAAAQGKLLVGKCSACGEYHHYPRALCPFCLSDDVQWVEAKGAGEIYSYSVTRRGGPVAYCIAYVKLDEGVSMLTNIVDCDLDSVRIGQRVKVAFRRTEAGVTMPVFAPA